VSFGGHSWISFLLTLNKHLIRNNKADFYLLQILLKVNSTHRFSVATAIGYIIGTVPADLPSNNVIGLSEVYGHTWLSHIPQLVIHTIKRYNGFLGFILLSHRYELLNWL
jgi:hypothetical protein